MIVLVTGSSRGIGRAIALRFLAEGHTVHGLDLRSGSIEHPNYIHHTAAIQRDDLPELDDVEILINNAGVQDSGEDIEVNLMGTIRVTEEYAFHEGIHSVLFIASASASTGAEFPAYAASKGGVVSYMRNTALRLAPLGATVNSLSPGGVRTELNDRVMYDPALWDRIMAETPLRKWASPEEIADWAYFVTVVNRSMTAQDLLIDNGEANRANFIW